MCGHNNINTNDQLWVANQSKGGRITKGVKGMPTEKQLLLNFCRIFFLKLIIKMRAQHITFNKAIKRPVRFRIIKFNCNVSSLTYKTSSDK